ncbi:DMT family transporter [Niallia circulans]|uniref:DMT family transporter n=1 Tax=Niallia circulans TaxID=1397 RepID=UPI00155F818B|nr:DMT family transporter [Niallia circulans]NRG31608.1 DMT family transporter [Niallia circulans]
MLSLLVIFFTLLGGGAISAQSSLNSRLSKTIGLLETVFFSFASGALVLGVLVVFFGNGNIFALIHAPKLELFAVFLGIAYVFLSTFNVNKLGVTAANFTAIVGQLLSGFIIDALGLFGSEVINLSWQRCISILLMIGALALISTEKSSPKYKTLE